MRTVSMKARAHAFRSTSDLGVVWAVLIVALVLMWGCGGVTNGKSAQATGPGVQNLTISGTISPSAAGNGAAVALSGVSTATVTADNLGNYTFGGLANGTYVVAPSHTGYSFAPGTQAVTLNGTNATGVNFTGTSQQTYSISGTISPTTGGAGATVTLGGAAAATTTSDNAGAYTFMGLLNGTYTVTPTSRGFSYSPTSQNVALNTGNVTAINFTATPQVTHTVSLTWNGSSTTTVTGYNVYRSTVSGTLFARVNGTPVTGLAYTDSTVQNGVTYYFVTTAVDPIGGESVFSNQVPAVIP
jgi:phage protein U